MIILGENKKGFTMMELLTAVAIFCIVILIIIQAFLKVLEYNRLAIQNQGIQDHTEFLFQLMTREIRMAKINYDDSCINVFPHGTNDAPPVVGNQIFSAKTGSDWQLEFKNANDECVRYAIVKDGENKRLRVERGKPGNLKLAFITPSDINILNSTLRVTNRYNYTSDLYHPETVSYYLKLESKIWNPPIMEFTNFITARNSEQF